MRVLAYAGAIILLAGCTTVSQVRGPDGKVAYAVNCRADRGACFQKAGELCPTGYTLLDASQGLVMAGTVMAPRNEMLFSCK